MEEINFSFTNTAKCSRRSSILKPPKPRIPMQDVFCETTNVTSTKRVSFAGTQIKEFLSCPIKSTLWGSSYEQNFSDTLNTNSTLEDDNKNPNGDLNTSRIFDISRGRRKSTDFDVSMREDNQMENSILCNQSLNVSAIITNEDFDSNPTDNLHNDSNEIFFMHAKENDEDKDDSMNRSQDFNNTQSSNDEDFSNSINLMSDSINKILNPSSKFDISQELDFTDNSERSIRDISPKEIKLLKRKSVLIQNHSNNTLLDLKNSSVQTDIDANYFSSHEWKNDNDEKEEPLEKMDISESEINIPNNKEMLFSKISNIPYSEKPEFSNIFSKPGAHMNFRDLPENDLETTDNGFSLFKNNLDKTDFMDRTEKDMEFTEALHVGNVLKTSISDDKEKNIDHTRIFNQNEQEMEITNAVGLSINKKNILKPANLNKSINKLACIPPSKDFTQTEVDMEFTQAFGKEIKSTLEMSSLLSSKAIINTNQDQKDNDECEYTTNKTDVFFKDLLPNARNASLILDHSNLISNFSNQILETSSNQDDLVGYKESQDITEFTQFPLPKENMNITKALNQYEQSNQMSKSIDYESDKENINERDISDSDISEPSGFVNFNKITNSTKIFNQSEQELEFTSKIENLNKITTAEREKIDIPNLNKNLPSISNNSNLIETENNVQKEDDLEFIDDGKKDLAINISNLNNTGDGKSLDLPNLEQPKECFLDEYSESQTKNKDLNGSNLDSNARELLEHSILKENISNKDYLLEHKENNVILNISETLEKNGNIENSNISKELLSETETEIHEKEHQREKISLFIETDIAGPSNNDFTCDKNEENNQLNKIDDNVNAPNLESVEDYDIEIPDYDDEPNMLDSPFGSTFGSNSPRKTLYRPSSIHGNFTRLISDDSAEFMDRTIQRDNMNKTRMSSRYSNVFGTTQLLNTPAIDKTFFKSRQSLATIRGDFTQILNHSYESVGGSDNISKTDNTEQMHFNSIMKNDSSFILENSKIPEQSIKPSLENENAESEEVFDKMINHRMEQTLHQEGHFELMAESPLKMNQSCNSPAQEQNDKTKDDEVDEKFELDIEVDPFDWNDVFISEPRNKYRQHFDKKKSKIITISDEQKTNKFADLLVKLENIKKINDGEELRTQDITVPTLMEAIQLKNRSSQCNWAIKQMDEDRWYFSFLQGINLLKIKFTYGSERFSASMITRDKDSMSNMTLFLGELLIQKFNLLNITFRDNCEIMQLLEALSDYQDELLTMNAMHETISALYEDYKFEKYRTQVKLPILTQNEYLEFLIKINFRYWPSIKSNDISIIDLHTDEELEENIQMELKQQIISLKKGPIFLKEALDVFCNYFKST